MVRALRAPCRRHARASGRRRWQAMRQRPRLDWQTERCDGVMAELKVWGDSYRTTSLRTISSVPPAKPSSSLLQSVSRECVATHHRTNTCQYGVVEMPTVQIQISTLECKQCPTAAGRRVKLASAQAPLLCLPRVQSERPRDSRHITACCAVITRAGGSGQARTRPPRRRRLVRV